LRGYPITLVLSTLTLAGAAGCGGGGSPSTKTHTSQASEFPTQEHAATAQLKNVSEEIGAAIEQAPHLSDAQLGQEFRVLASRWQEQLSSLESLTAPASLAVGYNTLKDAASRVESDLNAVISASATHSKTAGEQAGASLVDDVLSAKSASEKLDKQMSSSSTGATS
jgi:hypothetical protein